MLELVREELGDVGRQSHESALVCEVIAQRLREHAVRRELPVLVVQVAERLARMARHVSLRGLVRDVNLLARIRVLARNEVEHVQNGMVYVHVRII